MYKYACTYICIYVYIVMNTCDKKTSTETSVKQLQITCGYIYISQAKQKQTNK